MGVNLSPTVVSPKAIERARRLRREMTDGERQLWQELKEFKRLYGIHVRKQAPIGPCVVDFAIQSARLVIELDGHFRFMGDQPDKDIRRDKWLHEAGYKVLRINTGEFSDNRDGCIEAILSELGLME